MKYIPEIETLSDVRIILKDVVVYLEKFDKAESQHTCLCILRAISYVKEASVLVDKHGFHLE